MVNVGQVVVIVPNWNGAHLLRDCLDSLRGQTMTPGQTIVVDDGSTDDSVTILRSEYPEVTLIERQVNGGYCRAVNAGIRASSGEHVLLLNNDAEAEPNWLAELVRAMEADAGLGSCASKMIFRDDPTRINSAGVAFRVDGVARDIGYGQPDGPQFCEAREVFGACGGAAVYRRSALEDVGLFDEDFDAYAEDTDWAFRAQLLGYRCRYLPTAVVQHRGHASFGRESHRAVFNSSRNAIYLVVKNMPDRLLLKYGARITVAQLYQVAYFASRRRAWPSLCGKVAALANLGRTLEKRREIMRRRRVADEVLEARMARGLEHSIHFRRALPDARGR